MCYNQHEHLHINHSYFHNHVLKKKKAFILLKTAYKYVKVCI